MNIKITKIEKEILQLLSRGDTRKQIAQKLNMSYYHCRQIISSTMKKLQAKNATQGVILALYNGFIE